MLVGLLSIEVILVLIFGIEPKTSASKKTPEIDFKGSACSAWPPPHPASICFSSACSHVRRGRQMYQVSLVPAPEFAFLVPPDIPAFPLNPRANRAPLGTPVFFARTP
jgi:hypothetical protein